MNEKLHVALAVQLDTEKEISFMYRGLTIYVHDHSTEGWEFDVGERIGEEESEHLDGGFYDGTASDVIDFACTIADDQLKLLDNEVA